MHKLRISDPAGIMGKTLGRTVKLPAAVTYIRGWFKRQRTMRELALNTRPTLCPPENQLQ